MNAMIKVITTFSLCMISIISYADKDSIPLAENYECQSTDASQKTLSYQLNVKSTGSTYTFEWQKDNKTAFYGTGVAHPEKNDAMSVIFWDANNNDVFGVELFKIKEDGTLSSSWVMHGDTKVGTEICKKK